MANKTLSEQAKERDNFTCTSCGKRAEGRDLHTHHIVPKALGGRGVLSNLKTLCFGCHRGTHRGELSPRSISKKNEEGGGLATRIIANIIGVNTGTVNEYRCNGWLPVAASIDDVERLIRELEKLCGKNKSRKSLYTPERIEKMWKTFHWYKRTGDTYIPPIYQRIIRFIKLG